MIQRSINGVSIGAIGLGCMGMSWAYGTPDNAQSVAVLRRALELGVNHWDTADLYGSGENESLLSQILPEVRDQVFLATKFGNVYDRAMTSHQDLVEMNAPWIVDGTPEYAHKCIDRTLKRLGVDHVDLYYLHRVDARTPIEETVGAMAEMVKAGKVKALGLSEVSTATLKRANAVHPIAAVQNECSLWTRDFVDTVIPACQEMGIAFVPYSPLGRGFLTGQIKSVDDLIVSDGRRNHPRFAEENFAANMRIVETVRAVARRHDATPAQVAIAWTLSLGDHVAPIPGTKRVKYLEENAVAASLSLTDADVAELNSITPASGPRYLETAMAHTNR
ncbi:MAG: aldo/keto reductase [Fimbriimonadaceae bacterium]|nr:aldo/keto reductase [Fimbriimonadaceae bacterium]